MDEINAMWEANPQGGGVAWREQRRDADADIVDEHGQPQMVVKWRKGLSLVEMQEQIANLPTPFVAHFRVASVGDGGVKWLTHPFPIQEGVPLTLEGTAEHSVLFHNGHWGRWEAQSREWLGLAGGRIRVPHGGGKWSDSRAMAFWAFHFGLGIFEGDPWGIREKVVVYSPEDIQIFGDGWKRYKDYIISNDFWIKKIDRRSLLQSGTTGAAANHGFPSHGGGMYGRNGNHAPSAPNEAERINSQTSMFGPAGSSRSDHGTGQQNLPAPAVAGKETPFVKARREYEEALRAYGMRQRGLGKKHLGSKTQMKKKKKKWEAACYKFPKEYQAWMKEAATKAVAQTNQVLLDLGQIQPKDFPQTMH